MNRWMIEILLGVCVIFLGLGGLRNTRTLDRFMESEAELASTQNVFNVKIMEAQQLTAQQLITFSEQQNIFDTQVMASLATQREHNDLVDRGMTALVPIVEAVVELKERADELP